MVSMRDVARAAGVSVKTVSRVHNGDPNVAPETRERVEQALATLGYLPNALATTFREGRSPVVGAAVPDVSDPYFASLVRGLDTVAARNGLVTVVASIADAETERERVAALLSTRLRGLVIAPASEEQSYLKPWSGQVPIVFVDRPPIKLTADWIGSDDRAGAIRAVAHLAGLGHTEIAFVGDTLGLSTTAARWDGYVAATAELGLTTQPAIALREATARADLEAALDARPATTAVFCSNARLSMLIAPALSSRGLDVVSFGDFPLAGSLTPPVTALDQHPEEIGRLAGERLLERIAHPRRRLSRRVEVPTTLVERGGPRST